MRKRLIVGGITVNIVLALGLLAWPAASQILPTSIFDDCCENGSAGPYCCDNCCLFTNDCSSDQDCKE